jgi:hypothetical protein
MSTGQYRTVANGYAPTDGSILEIPVSTADLGLSPSNPTFTYQVYSTTWRSQLGGQVGVYNAVPGIATFNAFTPSISTGDWVPVAPGKTASVPVSIDPQEWLKSPALGLMIVNLENRSGSPQATLLRVGK